jgi:ATP-dependent exoDNAse (exonuclease V) beta subunit
MHLSIKNSHIRDSNIQFFEENHRYVIHSDPDFTYTSVTTWVHQFVQEFDADAVIKKMMNGKNWNSSNKYWGLTPDQIKSQWNNNGKSASQLGTEMHYNIECFMNNIPQFHTIQHQHDYTHNDLLQSYIPTPTPSDEWRFFINYITNLPNLKPFRTEWLVYNEDIKISGSIDMVYINDDNTLSIYDWKRAKSIDEEMQWKKYMKPPLNNLLDTNYWHYALQLNIYKMILETKYGYNVKELFLVQLHPNFDNYNLIPLPFLNDEVNRIYQQRFNLFNNNDSTT